MSIITLIVVIAIVGVITWAICQYLPMDPKFKTLIVVVAIIACALYALAAFGVLGSVSLPRTNVR